MGRPIVYPSHCVPVPLCTRLIVRVRVRTGTQWDGYTMGWVRVRVRVRVRVI